MTAGLRQANGLLTVYFHAFTLDGNSLTFLLVVKTALFGMLLCPLLFSVVRDLGSYLPKDGMVAPHLSRQGS